MAFFNEQILNPSRAALEYQKRTGQYAPGWGPIRPNWYDPILPVLGAAAGGAVAGPAGAAAGGTLFGGLTGGTLPNRPGGTTMNNGNGSLGGSICDLIFPSRGAEWQACMGIGGAVGLVPPAEGAEPGEACPTGYRKIGGTCVAERPGAYLPGGQPATLPTSGTALGTGWEPVVGSFNLPGVTPLPVQRTRLECPAGMVLGRDDICYPKSTPGMGRRGSWRKWKGQRRPKVSAAEWRTLQRAARVQDKVKDVAKEAGYTVKKRGR